MPSHGSPKLGRSSSMTKLPRKPDVRRNGDAGSVIPCNWPISSRSCSVACDKSLPVGQATGLRREHSQWQADRDDESWRGRCAPLVAHVLRPRGTPEAGQVSGMPALTNAFVSAARNVDGERHAALEHAADLAARSGDGSTMWFGFDPSHMGIRRISVALEVDGPNHRPGCMRAQMVEIFDSLEDGGSSAPTAVLSCTERPAPEARYSMLFRTLPR